MILCDWLDSTGATIWIDMFTRDSLTLSNRPSRRTLFIRTWEPHTPTGVGLPSDRLPDRYSLFQNYPNPFNPTTTISYSLPRESLVTLKIFDILGREVATLVNRRQTAGEYSAEWDGRNMPSGVYLSQFSAGRYSETRCMLIIR